MTGSYANIAVLVILGRFREWLAYLTKLTAEIRSCLNITMSTSVSIRQNYSPEVEEAVSKLANLLFYQSYNLSAIGFYFQRPDQGNNGAAFNYFISRSDMVLGGDGFGLLDYQNERGGSSNALSVRVRRLIVW